MLRPTSFATDGRASPGSRRLSGGVWNQPRPQFTANRMATTTTARDQNERFVRVRRPNRLRRPRRGRTAPPNGAEETGGGGTGVNVAPDCVPAGSLAAGWPTAG